MNWMGRKIAGDRKIKWRRDAVKLPDKLVRERNPAMPSVIKHKAFGNRIKRIFSGVNFVVLPQEL